MLRRTKVERVKRLRTRERVARPKKRTGSPFWRMPVEDADNCGEWQVTMKGATWVLAKLVGNKDAAVTFADIANTCWRVMRALKRENGCKR